MTPARLVTVPFSHYCEKARWALDRVGVAYVEEGHVPGFHRRAVRRAGSATTSVPVLITEGLVLGDSTDILRWADRKAMAGRELYPPDASLGDEVAKLEDHLDDELGPHLRRVLYFHLLPSTHLAFALMDQETPLWERALLRALSPFLFRGMRRFMRIDARSAADSRARVMTLLDELDARLADGRRFLVGDRFTAADLTLAALAAPAVMPPSHPVRFPSLDALPVAVAEMLREVQARPTAEFIRRLYREQRRV
jgi:glutathione S-transferase